MYTNENMLNKEEYMITYITIGGTICTSIIAWIFNKMYDTIKQIQSSKSDRYRNALTSFYWPLYISLLEIRAYVQLEREEKKKDKSNRWRMRKRIEGTLELIRVKIGTAFPKKTFVQPLLDLIDDFARALQNNGNELKYLKTQRIDKTLKLIKARLLTLASRYDMLNSFEDDYCTLHLYLKCIQYFEGIKINMPNETLFYWFKPFYNKKIQEYKNRVIRLCSENDFDTMYD